MAYAAVVSLEQTIDRLLNSSRISILPPFTEFIEFGTLQEEVERMDSSSKAFSEVVLEMLGVNSSLTRSSRKKFLPEILEFESLREVLKRLDSSSKRMNALDGQIRDASCKLEDVLESHVLNQFLSQSEILGEESHPLSFSLDLQEIKQDIDSFTQTVKKLKEEYIKELSNPLSEEDDAVSSRIDFGVKKSNLVGLSHELIYFKHLLLRGLSKELEIVSILGMAGIGKTTLAKEIFEDPLILRHFNCRAWVTVGPKYQLKEILQSILAQVNPDIAKLLTEGDEELADLKRMMYESLKGRRYLIVLDDIWKRPVWDDLKFPKKKNGNRILLTTRLEEVAHSASFVNTCRKSFLNKEESWYLLREKVFGKELCPPELEKAGKKIAENCEGLPLTIVTVGDLLSKDEKTPEYWKKVAEKENSIFMDANDQMYKVLFLSYNYLPQHLKACFLYMGVFPQNYEIPLSKLINLWRAEGFLEPEPFATSEYFALECLRGLVSRSIVMVRQNTSRNGIKTCGLHSAFWHLCIREAGKNKFLHVLNSYADGLAEDIKSQRRLCIHKSILFGIKDVYKSMASISTARFLLCTGPPHQYPVPICFGLRLLRVLDALSLRFYEFPIEVLKLVQLRYLALTYNGKLPASISKLWNLLCLIVYRHLSIKSSGAPSYLPVEIWDMQEVKHLQIMGSDLPDPCGALLPNLLTLLDVSAHSCTKGVLERIPNLKKLGIRIELAPDAAEPLCCFDHISHLDELESLKCVIVNPILRSEVAAPPPPLSIFPSGLKKLTLSGFGYPWEELSKIASLPNLEVFKLQCYAFRGPKWETCRWGFPQLKVLLIEDNDLVHWTVGHDSFPWLEHLSIICCYKLEQIPRQFAYGSLRMIELIDCNPLAVTRAKQIKEIGEKARDYLDVYIDVRVHSSWDDGHLKS